MTDLDSTADAASHAGTGAAHRSDRAMARVRRRYAAERRFRAYGVVAIAAALLMLAVLLVSIVSKGYSAFVQTHVTLDFALDPQALDLAPATDGSVDPAALARADFQPAVDAAVERLFPDVEGRTARRALRGFVSSEAAYILRRLAVDDPSLLGRTVRVTVPVASDIDQLHKGKVDLDVPEDTRRVSDQQVGWYRTLLDQGLISAPFNWRLLGGTDSRYPELAGLWGAIAGSFYMLLVTLAISFPVGVAAAVYLEEFAPKNRWTDLIEVNINNLAAVPSIIFGLLGLAVFINVFGLPRSTPLVGGMVLALINMPIIIIAGRASLKAVPPSIREAALGMGASRLQTIFHHVLPLAMPGMLTGTIVGMAHALGETAPLLMIGMNAFITSAPSGIATPATALPVQVYIWADSPEPGFVERTSAAIMVLLGFLICMNAFAVWLRRKFERRW